MKCTDFVFGETVLVGGRACKVLEGKDGWLTVVPVEHCNGVLAAIIHSEKVRPNDVQKTKKGGMK